MATKKEKDTLMFKLGEMHADIKNIYAETKKTNGRVTRLENEVIPKLDERLDGVDIRLAKYAAGLGVVLFLAQQFLPQIIDKLF